MTAAVLNRPQKITFAEMRVRLPRDESKKPPDLRREVFVWPQRFAFFAFFFLAFAFLGAFVGDFLADFLAFLPTLFFGLTFLATFFAARRTFFSSCFERGAHLRLRHFRWCLRRDAYRRISCLLDDSFNVVHLTPQVLTMRE